MCNWDLPTRPPLGSVGEESRMEEGVKRAPGVETLFPVCISCVFNVKLRARGLFPVCDGCQAQDPRHKDNTLQEPTSVSNGPGSRYKHQDTFTASCIQKFTK